jgi:hypothetical protein
LLAVETNQLCQTLNFVTPMRAAPTIAGTGGGAGFTSVNHTANNVLLYQTTRGQTTIVTANARL